MVTIPRLSTTYPLANPNTPPIPIPAQNGANFLATLVALKSSVESLTGQRGAAEARAVTFRDLVEYGLLSSSAINSKHGRALIGAIIDSGPYLPLAGGTLTGPLTLAGAPTVDLHAATKLYVDGGLALKAPVASPVFTGDPRAPTPAIGDNDTSIATSAFVQTALGLYMQWEPFVGVGQAFEANDLTCDGAWTMIAKTATTTRPAPQPSGPEEDLLPAWTPDTGDALADYVVFNEWTLAQSGWIEAYGVDILSQNLGMTHTIGLTVNGVARDSISVALNAAGTYLRDLTPIIVAAGAVIRVTLQVVRPQNERLYWYESPGLFATTPTYTSLARGSKDGGALSDTAYGCRAMFTPGTSSADWEVVAYGGGAAGGSGQYLPLTGGTLTGVLSVPSAGFEIRGGTSGAVVLAVPAVAGANTLTLPAGTTNFSVTGGASQVVKQLSSGGPFTVGQLAAIDLSNGITGSGAIVLASAPVLRPAVSTTPSINGDLVIEATSNTLLTIKLKGTDGVVRSTTLTLA